MSKLDSFLQGFFGVSTDERASYTDWVEWVHVSQGKTHCTDCLILNGCWFLGAKSPNAPLHLYCHCTTEPVSYSLVVSNAETDSAYSKFDPYLFDPENQYKHQKGELFAQWGYTIDDAKWLQEEMERQAISKYVSGRYTLGRRDKNGQRINIRIELERKDGSGTVSFISGWMVYPGGQIKLTTPYGGK